MAIGAPPGSAQERAIAHITARAALAAADSRDALDDYIEAHIHGPIELGHDVEARYVARFGNRELP